MDKREYAKELLEQSKNENYQIIDHLKIGMIDVDELISIMEFNLIIIDEFSKTLDLLITYEEMIQKYTDFMNDIMKD